MNVVLNAALWKQDLNRSRETAEFLFEASLVWKHRELCWKNRDSLYLCRRLEKPLMWQSEQWSSGAALLKLIYALLTIVINETIKHLF